MEQRLANLENRMRILELAFKCPEGACIKRTTDEIAKLTGSQQPYRDRHYDLTADTPYWWRTADEIWTNRPYEICENCHKFDPTITKPNRVRYL